MTGEKVVEWLKNFGIKAAFVALTVLIGIIVIKLITMLLTRIFAKSKIDKAAANFVKSLVKAALILVIIFVAGYLIGISITALAAIIGAVTVAIGLALQGSLSNLASGILIAVTKPFNEGDYVEFLDASGKVQEIRLFNTHLSTLDNKRIIVPNSTITSSNIVNFTRQSERMLNMRVPVSYQSDLERVKAVLLEVAANHPLVIKDKDIICELHEYGASSLDFTLRAWTKTTDYWSAQWSINSDIIHALRENQIEIPYQKVDIYMR